MNSSVLPFVASAPWLGTASAGPADAAPLVRLDGVRRHFGNVSALDDVSLQVRRGEILGIIGRSGAGKSTLIRCVNGLERPDEGTVTIAGQEISGLSEAQLKPVRRRIGMIFQHFNLLSNRTVAENVALPLKIAGEPRSQREVRVAQLLDLIGLKGKENAYPAQLSGGQKQRVGIARALAVRPVLLLSDEATSALDPETTVSILDLLKDINARLGLTILLITHEMDVIRRICDRVAVLDRGRIVEEGLVEQVLASPRTDTTRSMLRSIRPELPPQLRALLSPVPNDLAVVAVELAGEAARAPLLARLALEEQVLVRLLHGGVDRVQGEPFATLFLGVPARDRAGLDRVLHHLRTHGSSCEVLGYVPHDA
jgi:D-methionine transport system ATP-binding protein